MPTRRKGRAAKLAALAAFALGCLFFAPVQLGGSTLYSATVGDSMEPRFHQGDLAVLRAGSSYRVGDVVLYKSPVLGRPVLHRIIVIQGGRYYFKGDHNDFVDPGSVTRSELLGKLSLRVPRAGRVLTWFGTPAHAALLAGVAVLFLLLGGGTKPRRRRRRGGRRRTRGSEQLVTTSPRRILHRPRKSFENIAGGGALLLALVLLTVGFGTSLKRPVQVVGFKHTGTFSYKAKVVHPPAGAYPSGFARTGQPLYLSLFKLINLDFSYRFRSTLPHNVRGTVTLVALLSSDSTLRNRYVLHKPIVFHGDVATIGGTFDLRQLRDLIAQLSVESGAVGSEYAIELQPIVHLTGVVGGKHVTSTFSPVLPFTATQTVLKPNVAQAASLPGASYTLPSGQSALLTALNPTQTGRIPGIAPNYVSFARYEVAASTVRGVGLGLAGLALIILLSKRFKPRRELWSREKRIAFRYGCVVVNVVSVGDDLQPGRLLTEVPDFESLAKLAQYCERPILLEGREDSSIYAVEDDGVLYVHRPTAEIPVVPALVVAARRPGAPRARRRLLSRAFGAFFALAVVVALVTSFTATNTVPLSHADSVSPALSVMLGAPAQCAGLALTNLVIATTGSATVTGTSGNDLILGQKLSGTRNLNGGAGNDCIVGGGQAGTTNNFDGGTGTDACLGAPGATNRFTSCSTTAN